MQSLTEDQLYAELERIFGGIPPGETPALSGRELRGRLNSHWGSEEGSSKVIDMLVPVHEFSLERLYTIDEILLWYRHHTQFHRDVTLAVENAVRDLVKDLSQTNALATDLETTLHELGTRTEDQWEEVGDRVRKVEGSVVLTDKNLARLQIKHEELGSRVAETEDDVRRIDGALRAVRKDLQMISKNQSRTADPADDGRRGEPGPQTFDFAPRGQASRRGPSKKAVARRLGDASPTTSSVVSSSDIILPLEEQGFDGPATLGSLVDELAGPSVAQPEIYAYGHALGQSQHQPCSPCSPASTYDPSILPSDSMSHRYVAHEPVEDVDSTTRAHMGHAREAESSDCSSSNCSSIGEVQNSGSVHSSIFDQDGNATLPPESTLVSSTVSATDSGSVSSVIVPVPSIPVAPTWSAEIAIWLKDLPRTSVDSFYQRASRSPLRRHTADLSMPDRVDAGLVAAIVARIWCLHDSLKSLYHNLSYRSLGFRHVLVLAGCVLLAYVVQAFYTISQLHADSQHIQ